MNKHLGDDRSCRAYFHIIDIDHATASVVIQYVENDWLRGTDRIQQLPWIDFLNGLREGRYEIHRKS